jgi:hypothetical protein
MPISQSSGPRKTTPGEVPPRARMFVKWWGGHFDRMHVLSFPGYRPMPARGDDLPPPFLCVPVVNPKLPDVDVGPVKGLATGDGCLMVVVGDGWFGSCGSGGNGRSAMVAAAAARETSLSCVSHYALHCPCVLHPLLGLRLTPVTHAHNRCRWHRCPAGVDTR